MFTAKEIVSSELNRWLGDNSPLSGKARFWKMFEDNSKNCKWLSDEDVKSAYQVGLAILFIIIGSVLVFGFFEKNIFTEFECNSCNCNFVF